MCGGCYMGLTILKKKSGYALGLIFCIVGIIILLLVLWDPYDAGALTSFSAVSEQLLKKNFVILGTELTQFGLKLVHYTILGVARAQRKGSRSRGSNCGTRMSLMQESVAGNHVQTNLKIHGLP
jgi:hypothetical protein